MLKTQPWYKDVNYTKQNILCMYLFSKIQKHFGNVFIWGVHNTFMQKSYKISPSLKIIKKVWNIKCSSKCSYNMQK